jgi:hypothetical protein
MVAYKSLFFTKFHIITEAFINFLTLNWICDVYSIQYKTYFVLTINMNKIIFM